MGDELLRHNNKDLLSRPVCGKTHNEAHYAIRRFPTLAKVMNKKLLGYSILTIPKTMIF